ncbi:hypothetical protein EGW08_009402, partial [Elysia chlorotica]
LTEHEDLKASEVAPLANQTVLPKPGVDPRDVGSDNTPRSNANATVPSPKEDANIAARTMPVILGSPDTTQHPSTTSSQLVTGAEKPPKVPAQEPSTTALAANEKPAANKLRKILKSSESQLTKSPLSQIPSRNAVNANKKAQDNESVSTTAQGTSSTVSEATTTTIRKKLPFTLRQQHTFSLKTPGDGSHMWIY